MDLLTSEKRLSADPLDELEQDNDIQAAITDVEELQRKQAEILRKTRLRRFRDTLLEWGHDSSYDGIASLVRADNNKVRLFWTVLVVASLAIFFYLLFITLRTYLAFETTVELEFKYEQFEFPALTICNANHYKLSQLYKNPNLEALVRLYDKLLTRGRLK